MNSQFNSRITTDNCFLYNSNLSSEENYLTQSKSNYKKKFKKRNFYPSTNNSSTIFSYPTQFDTIGNELNCSIDMINKQLSNMVINKKNILSINPKLNHLNNIQNFNFTIEGGNFYMNDLYEENYKLKEENKFLLEKIEEINLSRVDNLSDGPILDDFCNEIGSLKEQISFNENTLANIKSEYQKLLIENDELSKKNIEFNNILKENENLRNTVIELNNKLEETNGLKNEVSKISEKFKNFQEIQSKTIIENKEKKRENEQLKKRINEYNIEKESLIKKISDLKKKIESMNLQIHEAEIIKAQIESLQLLKQENEILRNTLEEKNQEISSLEHKNQILINQIKEYEKVPKKLEEFQIQMKKMEERRKNSIENESVIKSNADLINKIYILENQLKESKENEKYLNLCRNSENNSFKKIIAELEEKILKYEKKLNNDKDDDINENILNISQIEIKDNDKLKYNDTNMKLNISADEIKENQNLYLRKRITYFNKKESFDKNYLLTSNNLSPKKPLLSNENIINYSSQEIFPQQLKFSPILNKNSSVKNPILEKKVSLNIMKKDLFNIIENKKINEEEEKRISTKEEINYIFKYDIKTNSILSFNLITHKFKLNPYTDNPPNSFRDKYIDESSSNLNVPNGLYLLTCRKQNNSNLNIFYYYDNISHSLIKLTSPKQYHYKSILISFSSEDSQKIICISGTNTNSVEEYFVNKNKWKDLPSLNTYHSDAGVLIIDYNLYIFFGYDFSNQCYNNCIEVLNLQNPIKWKIIETNFEIRCHTILNLGSSFDNKLIIFGGFLGDNSPNHNLIECNLYNDNCEIVLNKKIDKKEKNVKHAFIFREVFVDYDCSCNKKYGFDEFGDVHIIDCNNLNHKIIKPPKGKIFN